MSYEMKHFVLSLPELKFVLALQVWISLEGVWLVRRNTNVNGIDRRY
jgi:hypothetical protein